MDAISQTTFSNVISRMKMFEFRLKFHWNPINNIPAFFQIMAWRHPSDKPLSEPMMVILPTHIFVTRPQWVNTTVQVADSLYTFNRHHALRFSHFPFDFRYPGTYNSGEKWGPGTQHHWTYLLVAHLPLDTMAPIFKYIFFSIETFCKISLIFVPKSPIDDNPALVQIMAWRRIGEKPLFEPMLTRLTDAWMRH